MSSITKKVEITTAIYLTTEQVHEALTSYVRYNHGECFDPSDEIFWKPDIGETGQADPWVRGYDGTQEQLTEQDVSK